MSGVGTKELKDLLDFALTGVEAGVKMAVDGKLDMADLVQVWPVVQAAPAAFSGLAQIPAELKDMDTAEASELVAHVVSKLAVDDAKAVVIIDASFKMLLAGHGLYLAIKAAKA